MALDSEIAIVGTGLAALCLASKLSSEGQRVLLLNPAWDFYSEGSEFGFAPLWNHVDAVLENQEPMTVFDAIKDDFPGSIEIPVAKGDVRFRDLSAPHIRQRSAVWINPSEGIFRTLQALKGRSIGIPIAASCFPGVASNASPKTLELDADARCVQIQGLSDVDVGRYQAGVLEFLRERLGSERILCGVSDLEVIENGIRFFADHRAQTAKIKKLIIFWTPRVTQWIVSQIRKSESVPIEPRGLRCYEEWSLISRDPVDPTYFGYYKDFVVWADVEGRLKPETPIYRLNCMKRGKLHPYTSREGISELATQESFESLEELCRKFLGWEKFSIRSLKARALLEWERSMPERVWPMLWSKDEPLNTLIVCRCEGWIAQVLRTVKEIYQEVNV